MLSRKSDYAKVLIFSILCAILPDGDVLGFKFGVAYGDFLGHRGFIHSIFFATLVGFSITTLFFRIVQPFSKDWWKLSIYFAVIGSSHGVLDAFTNGGLGIALLAPFDNTRYFFWARPIAVSPINPEKFMTMQGLMILANEFLWVWLPSIFIVLIYKGLSCLKRIGQQLLDKLFST